MSCSVNRRQAGGWAAVAVVTTVVLALVPLLFAQRFYFADDTQSGAYGVWYSIGEHLRAGQWALFEPSRWMAGNYAAEGQWGIWNPVVLLLGLVTTVVPNAVVLCTAVKVVALGLASGGIFVLSRSYGARQAWATIAAVVIPLAGGVVYMDAASWVTGLFVWALLPWVWWGLRRTAFRRGNVVVPFTFGYLLVTVGYVHGTIMLVAAVIGVLIEGALARSKAAVSRALVSGVLLGLVALAVYLPGVLTAGVTARSDAGITNDNLLSPDLSGLAASTISTAHPWISGFWKPPLGAPILYLTWLLPALAFIDWRRAARVLPSLAAPLTVGLVSLALAFGPSQIGPLRFPVRVMPYVALAGVLLLAVLLSRAGVRPGKGRILGATGLVLAGWYSAFAADPASWIEFGAALVLAAGGIVAVGMLLRRTQSTHRSVAVVSVVIGVTALSTLLQHHDAPVSPLPDFRLPALAAEYQPQLSGVTGDTIVVGIPTTGGRTPWKETLQSNAWYLNDADVQNVYTALYYQSYAVDLCMTDHGLTCPAALARLFALDPTTGRPVVDLLAVNNVQILSPAATTKPSAPPADASFDGEPPPGWHVSQRGATTKVWSRNVPVPNAGGVVWSSPGTHVTVQKADKRDVRLRVDAVGPGGGRIALSRLAWPGYSVDGATQGAPLRDYLLTVDIPPASSGQDVTVSFSPPGWHLEIAALALAVLLALGWGGGELIAGRSRRRPSPVDATPAGEKSPIDV